LECLDRQAEGHVFDGDARAVRDTSLARCTSAQRAVAQISVAEDVRAVCDTVAEGRYALTCLQARIAGQPVPQERAMCFFDPRHGPSVNEVLWSRPGHGPRRVPACAGDATRVANKEAPEVRMVDRGAGRLPYWAAGSAFLAYTEGYFAAVPTLSWALRPAAVELAPTTSRHFDQGIVGSSGNFDGGGFDGSGGQSGGF